MDTPCYKKAGRGIHQERNTVEIFGIILSRLSLKDAVATSSLCKEFRYMWRSIDSLDFDAAEILRGFLAEKDREVRDRKTLDYVNWVTRVVRQLKEEDGNLKLFRACFCGIDERYRSEVDEWVQFAMIRRVEVLVLEFLADCSANFYLFPHKLTGFDSLKALELEFVDVTQDTLDDLVRNSPSLERLRVSFTHSLIKVAIIGNRNRPVALKSLVMSRNRHLKAIEIRNAPLLALLSYVGHPIDVVVENVPLLSESNLSYRSSNKDCIALPFSQLSSCISQLHTLVMDIHCMDVKVYKENHEIPELPNLKCFDLVVYADKCWSSLRMLTSFLKAFPRLGTLVLKMEFLDSYFSCDPRTSYRPRYEEKVTTYPHRYLKVLEIVRYRHRLNAVEHVRHVIETAIALEKIVINPVHWEFHHTGADRRKEHALMEEVARKGAVDMLKREVPSTIEFVVL
ncbi:uncharacterized protein LOC112182887 [Rosa chinensis]|uniref:uncharacterized protein LOC112182887 n=1 Tax=Rosa chinensis TaxID=74649 RepID=UPI000D092DBB|nr:uncharacterized protein LOC112182887 [Rosa chinensis]